MCANREKVSTSIVIRMLDFPGTCEALTFVLHVLLMALGGVVVKDFVRRSCRKGVTSIPIEGITVHSSYIRNVRKFKERTMNKKKTKTNKKLSLGTEAGSDSQTI